MKQKTRIFAILLAIGMTLSFAGCLVPKENQADETAAPASSAQTDAAPVNTSDYDPEAVAIELGDVKITAGEIEESYSYYVGMLQSYYGVEVSDDASINEYREMAIGDLIRYYVPEWKAQQLGISLTAEEEAAIEEEVTKQIEDMRTGLVCEFAHEYGGAEEVYDDIAKLSDEELDGAMTEINSELATYYGEGYTLESYLAEQQKSMTTDSRITALSEKLREASEGDLSIDDAQIDEWYEATLASQKSEYDEDHAAFCDAAESFDAGTSTVPVLYIPEGILSVQMIRVTPEAERDLKIETNRSEMTELEAEYGRLMLNNENAARQAEIVTRYAELKAESEELEETFIGESRRAINKAYEALEEGTPFEDVMKQYNADGSTAIVMMSASEDERYGELCEYASELLVGTYSEPILIDDVYYIVKLVEKPQAGAIDRASIAEAVETAAKDALKTEAWEQLLSEWETEAGTSAVRHEETYAAIGYLNN